MKYIFIFLCFFSLHISAQKHDNTWLFGYESSSATDGIEGSIGTFVEGNIEFIDHPIGVQLSSAHSMISDIDGNLLFYTNGCEVVTTDHEIMENGEGINPGEVHDIKCDRWYTSGSQSLLILPIDNNNNFYYLFQKLLTYVYEPEFDGLSTLLYSTIDMSLNNGKGGVVEKNIPLVEDFLTYGQLTAVKHANGIDWWLLNGGDTNNKYYSILFTANGVEDTFVQEIGDSTSHNGSGGGSAVFSPDGGTYVRYSAHDGIFLFDFDRTTGLLNNFRHLPVPEIENVISGGVAISPNSRYLYVSHTVELYQYDLWAEDIVESKILIDTYDGFLAPYLGSYFYNMQLAPDCRIYMTSQNTVDVLHVINNPDEAGVACNFEQHSISLPNYHAFSIPNFPNFRLGALVEGVDPAPPCELVVDVEEPAYPATEKDKVYVFPNPTSVYFKVVFERMLTKDAVVYLYDALGQQVLSKNLNQGGREFRIPIEEQKKGMYFYEVIREGVVVKSGKLVVL